MPKLSIDFEAKFASVLDGLDQIKRESAKTAQQMESAFSGLKGILTGAVALGAINELRSSFQQTVAALASFKEGAEKAGTSVENISALFYDLRDSAVSVETLQGATGKLVKTMQEAEKPTSDAADAFRKMGIAFKDSNGDLRDATEVFRDIADQFATYQDGANKVALAQVLFGKSGADLLPILKDLAEAGRQNAGVTADSAKAADDFQKALNRMAGESEKAKIEIVGGILPGLTDLITKFNDAKSAGLGFIDILDQIATKASNRLAAALGRPQQDVLENLKAEREALIKQIAGFKAASEDPLNRNADLSLQLYKKANDELSALEAKIARIDTFNQRTAERARPKTREEGIAEANSPRLEAPRVAATEADKVAKTKLDAGQRLIDQLEKQLATESDLTNYEKFHIELRQQIAKAIAEGNDEEARSLAAVTEQGAALARLIDQRKEYEASLKKEEELQKVIRESQAKEGQRIAEKVKAYQDLIDPAEKYREKLREITELEAGGVLNPVEAKRAREAISEQIDALDKEKQKVEEVKSAAEQLGLTFASSFEDAVVQGKGLRDILDGIYKDILKLAIRKSITEPAANALTGIFAGLFGGGMVVNGASGGTNNTGTNLRLLEGPQYDTSGLVGAAGVQQNINLYGSGVQMADVTKAVRAGNAELSSSMMDQQRRGGAFA